MKNVFKWIGFWIVSYCIIGTCVYLVDHIQANHNEQCVKAYAELMCLTPDTQEAVDQDFHTLQNCLGRTKVKQLKRELGFKGDNND